MRDLRTVGIAALTAFMVAAMTSPAADIPRPAAAPKHCSVQQCPPEPPLAARVKTLEAEVFQLRALKSCISGVAVETPDINGDPHPLLKWRKRCLR